MHTDSVNRKSDGERRILWMTTEMELWYNIVMIRRGKKSLYEEELSSLSSHTHGRNVRLLKIALLGRYEGLNEFEIAADILEAGGEPRLTDAEIRRAVNKAFSALGPYHNSPKRKVPRKSAAMPNLKAQGFVREMIELGGGEASSQDLMALSLYPIAQDKIFDGYQLLMELLPENEGEYYFAGDPYMKRTRDRLYTKGELIDLIFKGTLPTHFIPNPFTGEGVKNERGELSFAMEKTLKAKRLALIEFDELELKKQAAFWVGAIKTGLLPVASLIYSGGKSIHGLLRLKPEGWDEQWKTLEKLLASDPDKIYRCDLACRNAGRMTRFPFGKREETGRFQKILYIG